MNKVLRNKLLSHIKGLNEETRSNEVGTAIFLSVKEWNMLLDYINKLETNIAEAIELIKSKNNGKCIINGKEKNAYTFVLDFDKAREFIWELEEILERGKEC